jgi:hypothetical protein
MKGLHSVIDRLRKLANQGKGTGGDFQTSKESSSRLQKEREGRE